MATEPRVTMQTVDNTIGYSANPVDNRLNILCPVISPAGFTDLTRISGPSEFQKIYFKNASVKATDDMSAIYARALLANAPIWIKRATRNNIKGGLSSALGSEIFVDSSLNLIEGVKVKLAQDTDKVSSYTTALGTLSAETILKDAYRAYSTTKPTSSVIKDDPVSVDVKKGFEITTLTEDVKVTIGNTILTIKQGTSSLNDVVKTLHAKGILPQLAYDSTGTVNLVVDSDGNLTIEASKNITKILWASNIAIQIEDKYKEKGASIIEDSDTALYSCDIKTAEEYYDTIEMGSFVMTVKMSDSETSYVFYNDKASGSLSTSAIKVPLGNVSSFGGIFKELTVQCAATLGGDTGEGYSIILPGAMVTGSSITCENMKGTFSEINGVAYNDRFAVIAAFPCDTNAITVSIENGSIDDTYKISASYAGQSEEWEIAFDTSIINGYGESIYYQNTVNEESQFIRIVELEGTSVLPQTFVLGNEVTSQNCGVTEIISALENMKETDESTVFFDYICDGGIVNKSLSDYIWTLCDHYHSFYAPSVYTDRKLTASVLEKLRDDFGAHSQGRFIGHTQRAKVLDSGSVVMPASYFYLVTRIGYGNSALEFVNMFGQNYGDIGMQNPLQKFTTAEREELLDYQISTLKRGISSTYFLNENLTLYKVDSYLQEDGTMLMVNKMAQVADTYGYGLIAENASANVEQLWSRVTDELTIQLKSRLRVGTSYGPVSVKVVCDATNNPASLQRQGKLRIDIYATFGKSIKEVLIYSNIMPVE